MSNTKPAIPNSTVTRDVRELDKTTDNIYESIVIISKRANQIANNLKEELHGKLAEFASSNDNLEEVFENREQIEFLNIMSVCLNHRLLLLMNFYTIRFITAILLKSKTNCKGA